MMRKKIYILLLSLLSLVLIVLILIFNLRSRKRTPILEDAFLRSGLSRPVSEICGLIDVSLEGKRKHAEGIYGQDVDDDLEIYDNLEPVLVDDELNVLLDEFGIEEGRRIAIAHIQKVLCDPVIGSNYKTYDNVDFRNLLINWKLDKVKEFGEYLSSIFNEFVRLRSSIDNLGNDI
ncbi:BTA121 domain-containing protein surface lipoprotein, partial [Borrelia persica]|uniref:BTA121 domain-containing protein surface lipoprotein n=1 Tax=Borrelia persica TaxID=44448 RepID=UPI0004651C2D